jgi:hypothetical protein
VGRAGRPQAWAPAGAGGQGVGGRGRVGLREKWLYFSYTHLDAHPWPSSPSLLRRMLAQTQHLNHEQGSGHFDVHVMLGMSTKMPVTLIRLTTLLAKYS